LAKHRVHDVKGILTTAISRRAIVRSLLGGAATGALLGRGVLSTRAQATPVAIPTGAEEVPVPGEVVEFALSGGVTTHGQFDYPATGAPPYPAVLLIQGSGPIDRHETFIEPDGTVRRPFDLIAAALTSRGLAVFRYDKRGVCPPSQVCDPAAYTAQSKSVLTEDAALAYARMIANPMIDAKHTAVLGHSEGTWLAPALLNRFPEIQALVLISTGLGVMHALSFSQVTLPLLGIAPYDTDADGALAPDEVPLADPVAMARFQERIRPQGQLLLLSYEGSGQDPRPVGLNPKLDVNGDGKIDFLTELRPVYEAFFASIDTPLAAIEQYADPAILPIARAAFAEGFEAGMYASYQAEPLDQNLRTLLALPYKPRVLIVNGEHDDQTPASSAQLLGEGLIEAGFMASTRIYPGLSHVLSPQADIFAPYGADMQAEPIAAIGDWLVEAVNDQS
jgi:pimeloyl-ACP methyl ester carboxylesterase